MAKGKDGADGRHDVIVGDLTACWTCRQSLSSRELFCHACGRVQPLRAMTHFSRLGLEQRFDLDFETLEKHYTGFSRNLDPERFAKRGDRERGYVTRHLAAFTQAYDVLKDPIARARYLLMLEGFEADAGNTAGVTDLAEALRQDLAAADQAPLIDRIAAHANQAISDCMRGLANAFREGNLATAAAGVAALEALEKLASDARDRRTALHCDNGDAAHPPSLV